VKRSPSPATGWAGGGRVTLGAARLHGRRLESIVSLAVEPRRTSRRCPTCRAVVRWEDNPYRPFCSERCRMVDLGNWASERYRVAGDPIADDDEDSDGSSD